jgi:hypothetical protein
MHGRRPQTIVVLLFVGAWLLFVAAPAGANVTAAEAVQLLNHQRAANGIPADLVERPDWSSACAAHDRYEAQTGEFGHHEDPSSPFYTEEGAWAAANSVLAYGEPSWSQGNPWENAPIHLIQMLGPALAEMGADESQGRTCATTWPGYTRPDPAVPTAYSYPGNGVGGVVPSETASESPFVPGDFVGLPEGTTTGRHLLAFLSGPESVGSAEVAGATLSGPSGPVTLRVIDSNDPNIGAYMPQASAFLIPVQPLQPRSAYQASVDWAESGKPVLTQKFSFSTGTDPGEAPSHVEQGRKDGGCARYGLLAQRLRSRSARLRRRGATLAKAAASSGERSRARQLLRQSTQAKRQAKLRSRQAKRCRRHASSGSRPGRFLHR